MQFASFMASGLGRGLRIVVGAILIFFGIYAGGAGGWIVAIIGLVPMIAGLMNVCLFAPLMGAPFRGRDATR